MRNWTPEQRLGACVAGVFFLALISTSLGLAAAVGALIYERRTYV